MTDRPPPHDPLGPPPLPEDAAREHALQTALAHFDDLVVDGSLTPVEAGPPADELSRRRATASTSRTPQRWLVAAAVALVLGVGGAFAAQFVGGSSDQTTSEAGGRPDQVPVAAQADADSDAEAGAEPSAPHAAPDAEATPTTAAALGSDDAPPAPDVIPETVPQWLCALAQRLGIDVCAP